MTAKIIIGPANYAGQAYQWAQAMNKYTEILGSSFALRTVPLPMMKGFQFPAHRRLPHPKMSTPVGKRLRVDHILRGATHLAVDGFVPMLGRPGRASIEYDLEYLGRRGVSLALVAHGTDIRDPDRHMTLHEGSYFRVASRDWVELVRRTSALNREVARASGLPLFVSTPDLILDLPQAAWLPLSVEASDWLTEPTPLKRKRLRVLHLPSRRDQPIKGTDIIEPVLRELDSQAKIDYMAPRSVPHIDMPKFVKKADIVVEQIRAGSYGVAAVEAMAAGRLVIGGVGSETRAALPEDPPMVDATPADFRNVMLEILADPAQFVSFATAGPSYVKRWHDGAESARVITEWVNPAG